MVFDNHLKLNGLSIIRALDETLQRIDKRLMEHGERVAFVACEIAEAGQLPLDKKTLFLLCVFHDIGAYKTDDINKLLEFETQNVRNHAVYGYLFLKYMTPLGKMAQAVLHHHDTWEEIENAPEDWKEYAALIHVADRIDIAYTYGSGIAMIKIAKQQGNKVFKEEYIDTFLECCQKRKILERLSDGSFEKENKERVDQFHITTGTALEYLKMLVFSIDFRSEYTVTHSVNTIAIAQNIARHFKLSEEKQKKIWIGALLHDVGKISIPIEILEFQGRLDDDQMKIMRTHVTETEAIIKGIVPEEICRIAVRHHEKLDGTGYPYGLTAEELTFPERIVAVADVVSALGSKRSYKESFPKEKTLAILQSMRGSGLDAEICDYVCGEYEQIMWETDDSRNEIIQKYQTMICEYEMLV